MLTTATKQIPISEREGEGGREGEVEGMPNGCVW